MLIIVAVITAAATLQAAGGLDYLVKIAEKILRKNPAMITFLAPCGVLFLYPILWNRTYCPIPYCLLSQRLPPIARYAPSVLSLSR